MKQSSSIFSKHRIFCLSAKIVSVKLRLNCASYRGMCEGFVGVITIVGSLCTFDDTPLYHVPENPVWTGYIFVAFTSFLIILPSDPYILNTFYSNSSSSSELCDQSPAPLAFEGRGCYFTSLFETDLSSVVSSLEKYKKMAETQNHWIGYIHELTWKTYVCTGNKSGLLSCLLFYSKHWTSTQGK